MLAALLMRVGCACAGVQAQVSPRSTPAKGRMPIACIPFPAKCEPAAALPWEGIAVFSSRVAAEVRLCAVALPLALVVGLVGRVAPLPMMGAPVVGTVDSAAVAPTCSSLRLGSCDAGGRAACVQSVARRQRVSRRQEAT